jgi:hypothetical protein
MRLKDLPPGAIDWPREPASVQPGETGAATSRARMLGETQLRIVDYGPGYVADHWCGKGHILFVVSGALVIEHQDGNRYELGPGMSWHAADGEGPPHRVVTQDGARIFIID